MVSAAIIGTALNVGLTAPTRSLWIDGLDVTLKNTSGMNRYGVPLSSLTVTENGPDGVSNMHFTIEDPQSEITLTNGQNVLLFNHTTGVPTFRGFIQHFTTSVFGLGRQYDAEAVGVEAILDWVLLPADVTFASGMAFTDAVQSAWAQSSAGYPLRTFATNSSSTQALPVGDIAAGGFDAVLGQAVTVTQGTTLRECIRQIAIMSGITVFGPGATGLSADATIDFWYGLRTFRNPGTIGPPSDYAGVTLNAVPAGFAPASQNHENDSMGVVRSVFVKGGNAAGTGFVTDGTNLPGPVNLLEDATVLTADDKLRVGTGYLSDKTEAVRGQVNKQTFVDTSTVAAHVQAGANITLTDAQLGLSSATYPIGTITKYFYGGGLETWVINYGGMAPSLPRALRRLTRAVRN